MEHVFTYVDGFGTAEFFQKGKSMVCYIAKVGGHMRDFSSARKAKRFVRWFAGEVGTLGESETYTITRVSWATASAVYNNSQNETYSTHGVAWRTGEKRTEIVERGRVFYASL